jgi:predicted DNA binding CopG/RHH family protein
MSDQELAEEARRWDSRESTPAGWEDATDAVPHAKASESISLRLPKAMLAVLKEFARRENIGYQVLIKRWLDDRIRAERERRTPASPILVFDKPLMISQAASFDDKAVSRLPVEAATDIVGRLAALTVNK